MKGGEERREEEKREDKKTESNKRKYKIIKITG